jgi:hypothetical protein
MRRGILVAALCCAASLMWAAPRQHAIGFGKWMPVKLFVGPNENKGLDIKIRPLYIDGRLRDFTTGEPHDVTDRTFVVRRAYRVNDALPDDERALPSWKWQRGGWLLVDRSTGRVSNVNLPDFDPYYSVAAWYRDYVAYCGVSDSGERLYAVVAQLGSRKPILKKELGAAKGKDVPESECGAPEWQRQPMRVTFTPAGAQPVTFAVHGRSADVTSDEEASSSQ